MASTRFPGKPLAKIADVSMLRRTAHIAANVLDSEFVVATDHDDIAAHCEDHGLPVVMTNADLASGSDRALAASRQFRPEADIIVNLQGDAPFSDPSHISAVIKRLKIEAVDIATPAIRLVDGKVPRSIVYSDTAALAPPARFRPSETCARMV